MLYFYFAGCILSAYLTVKVGTQKFNITFKWTWRGVFLVSVYSIFSWYSVLANLLILITFNFMEKEK